MAGRSRTKLDCLDVLTGDEASAVLRHLLSSYPALIPEARQAANALLATVSFTDIARSVFEALTALDLDYAEDGPSELAGQAVEIWQRRRRNVSLPRTFIEKFTPEWDWLAGERTRREASVSPPSPR